MNKGSYQVALLACFGLFFGLIAPVVRAQLPVPDSFLHRCGTADYEQALQRRYPGRKVRLEQLNAQLRQLNLSNKPARIGQLTPIFRIPVVVHVVHANASGVIGGANNPNISDEQIACQIKVLNEDYRYQAGTNGASNPAGSDSGIEFFLAQTDPNGQPTSGITRHYYPQQTSFEAYNVDDALTLSQVVDWPSDRYLNIWVTTLQNNYLGFTQFTTGAYTLKGLGPVEDDRTDGSIIDYRYFGRFMGTATSLVYGAGRTATHELGHWLGLIHTWGDAVCGDDYVADTPPCEGPNQTVYCRALYSTCSGAQTRNLIEDYMDYSPDLCRSLFTPDQIQRMRAVLQLSLRRVRLIESVTALAQTEGLTLRLFPNPVRTEVTLEAQFKGVEPLTVRLYDGKGRLVRTAQYADSPSTRVFLSTMDLPIGIYVVRVSTTHETQSRQVLVE